MLVSKARAVITTARAERKKAQETVLAIGAHPDDVEIGCGGILLNHVRRGDRVVILTLSRGEAGGPQVERVRESRNAATALGAQLRMADLPDREISEGPATISVIEDVLRDVDPTVVYTHSDRDAHQDHRAVHRASVVACRGVPNVYCYQAPSTTVEFRPALFVNVADHLERKLEILDIYRTQASVRPYLKREQVRSTATYWGRFSDYEAVEPLEVVRRSA
jgi:LmbE family N-acetylglucosaminyl deacetylase